MSTTLTGDQPAKLKAPPATNGQVTGKARQKRVAKAPAVIPAARKMRAMGRKAAAKTPVRTSPIGIASGGAATDLLTGFIQSMPKAGSALAKDARDACKTTFGALIDWIYPADAKAA